MKISVFGLGYVGAVSAGCLTALGHDVIGVDPVETKVDLVNRGQSPVVEKDLDGLIARAVKAGKLRATLNASEAVAATTMSLVCVGTPSKPNGDLDVSHVASAVGEIGTALRGTAGHHTIAIRSTVLPGTTRNVVIPRLEEASGKTAGRDFGIGVNPEFLREGTAVADFHNPPRTVVGGIDARSSDLIASIYDGVAAPLIRTSIETGEMVKYADNIWHALKIAFANEIGSICKSAAIDSHAVMDIFCADTRLNLSPAYLRPGFAFGGSCLPKDVRALAYKARALDLETPVLNAILPSNRNQVERGFAMIAAHGKKRVAILGMSFKAGTDDMRESPLLELIERLIGKGYDLRIFDRDVNLARLVGANREYLLKTVPHISSLMVETMDEVLAHGETIVIGNADAEFLGVAPRLKTHQTLIDLVRIDNGAELGERYSGVNW